MKINSINAVLPTSNVIASTEYYMKIFNGKDIFYPGDKSEYAVVIIDDFSIHLAKENNFTPNPRHSIMIFVDDVNKYYEHCKNLKVEFIQELEDNNYKLRDFILKDLDGHNIVVAEHINK